MKRYALWFLLVMLVRSGFGQGAVDFRNGGGGMIFATPADRKIYSGLGGGPLVGTNYVAALFYVPGPDRGADLYAGGILAYGLNNLAYANFRPTNTTQPGIWLNSPQVGYLRYLVGVQPGQTATLQVRFWDITLHSNWEDAFMSGESQVTPPFNYTVPSQGASPEAYYMENLRTPLVLDPPRWRLRVWRTGDSVVVSWPSIYSVPFMGLEMSSDLAGPWTLVPPPYSTNHLGALGQVFVTNKLDAERRFYRLKTQTP